MFSPSASSGRFSSLGWCACTVCRGVLLRKRLQGKQPCHTHHLFINRLLVVRRFSKMVLCFKRQEVRSLVDEYTFDVFFPARSSTPSPARPHASSVGPGRDTRSADAAERPGRPGTPVSRAGRGARSAQTEACSACSAPPELAGPRSERVLPGALFFHTQVHHDGYELI